MKDEESSILRLESEDLEFKKDIELNINDLLYEFSTILNVNEKKREIYINKL